MNSSNVFNFLTFFFEKKNTINCKLDLIWAHQHEQVKNNNWKDLIEVHKSTNNWKIFCLEIFMNLILLFILFSEFLC